MTRPTTTVPRAAGPARQATIRDSGRKRRPAPRGDRRLRLFVFGGLALVVGSLALGLAITRLVGPARSDPNAVAIQITMDGFSPPTLTAKAGAAVSIDLVNPDSSMHSDGGGIHSFHIDALDVHEKVQPLSDLVFTFTAPTEPGTYDFYCDTCCGGRENPSMNGTLTVTA